MTFIGVRRFLALQKSKEIIDVVHHVPICRMSPVLNCKLC